MRVLLVEDDLLLGDGVKHGLIQSGYTVDWLMDGKSAKTALQVESFDLLILDVGLPEIDGFSLLTELRASGNRTPVLILTARDSIEDRIRGLDLGSDDYLTKPFDLDELCARVRALIRRSSGRADSSIVYRNLKMDPAAHEVIVDNQKIALPRREFSLLQKLLENVGHVISRDQLTQSVYGWSDELDSNALEVHIHNLRKKLNAGYIRTVRGVGYMIEKES